MISMPVADNEWWARSVFSEDFGLEHDELETTALDCLLRAAGNELMGGALNESLVEDWINAAGVLYGFRADVSAESVRINLRIERGRRLRALYIRELEQHQKVTIARIGRHLHAIVGD